MFFFYYYFVLFSLYIYIRYDILYIFFYFLCTSSTQKAEIRIFMKSGVSAVIDVVVVGRFIQNTQNLKQGVIKKHVFFLGIYLKK